MAGGGGRICSLEIHSLGVLSVLGGTATFLKQCMNGYRHLN